MTQPYNIDYDPPIPILRVRFSTPEWSLHTDTLLAIVDTGADGTLVPVKYLRAIDATVEGQSGLRSQWGERRTVNLYLVDLEVAELTLQSVWVIGDDLSDEVIIGRNVLNRLHLVLNGPTLHSEIVGF